MLALTQRLEKALNLITSILYLIIDFISCIFFSFCEWIFWQSRSKTSNNISSKMFVEIRFMQLAMKQYLFDILIFCNALYDKIAVFCINFLTASFHLSNCINFKKFEFFKLVLNFINLSMKKSKEHKFCCWTSILVIVFNMFSSMLS